MSLHDGGPGVPVIFGCETRETGEIFKQRADGLFGLGNSDASVINQLVAAGQIEDMFSLCFGVVEGDGVLMLGDSPAGREVPLQYTPFVPSPSHPFYYNVQLDALSVGGDRLDIPPPAFQQGYATVLDSGTTFTYIPTAAFTAFADAVEAYALQRGLQRVRGPDPQYDDICFGGAPEHTDVEALAAVFPSMQLHFASDVDLTLGPLNYLFVHTFNSGKYCLGVFDNGNAGTLLGGITFRNVLVQYDRANGRVGFGPAQCKELGRRHRPPCSAFAADGNELAAIVAVADGDCQPEAGDGMPDDYASEHEEVVMPGGADGDGGGTVEWGSDEAAVYDDIYDGEDGAAGADGIAEDISGGGIDGGQEGEEEVVVQVDESAGAAVEPSDLVDNFPQQGGIQVQDQTQSYSGSVVDADGQTVEGDGSGAIDGQQGGADVDPEAVTEDVARVSPDDVMQPEVMDPHTAQSEFDDLGFGDVGGEGHHPGGISPPLAVGLIAGTVAMLSAALIVALLRPGPREAIRSLMPTFKRYQPLDADDPEGGAGTGPGSVKGIGTSIGAKAGVGGAGGLPGTPPLGAVPKASAKGGVGLGAKPLPSIAVIAMTEMNSKVPGGVHGEKRVVGLTTPQKLQRTGSNTAAQAAAALAEELASMQGTTPRAGATGAVSLAPQARLGSSRPSTPTRMQLM